jgi:uncharacterized protein (TIGR03084 family)
MTTVAELVADLAAEHEALDAVVAPLTDDQWRAPTPSAGWAVRDQIGHLTYFDGTAALAITDEAAFKTSMSDLFASAGGEDGIDGATLHRHLSPSQLLEAWRSNRKHLIDVAGDPADDARLPWYGPSMSAKSFLTARLMETWAHGQDVVDAVAATRPASDRLRHIVQLGFITRGWSYKNRGLDLPTQEVRVELAAPSGDTWRFGPDEAADVVRGSAEDFCLVVTQRRHVDDTALDCTGDAARDWMEKAQAFAGPATEGPAPRGGAK